MMEYEKDWFMRQIKAVVFNPFKKNAEIQVMPMVQVTDDRTGETYSIPIQNHLLELVLKLKINQAENLLFSKSEKMTNEQFSAIGHWFYDLVDELPDEKLVMANFSKAEIEQGRADLEELL